MPQVINKSQEVINLRQLADRLGVHYTTAKKNWPKWVDLYKLNVRRFPKRTLRFEVLSVEAMEKSLNIVQSNLCGGNN